MLVNRVDYKISFVKLYRNSDFTSEHFYIGENEWGYSEYATIIDAAKIIEILDGFKETGLSRRRVNIYSKELLAGWEVVEVPAIHALNYFIIQLLKEL